MLTLNLLLLIIFSHLIFLASCHYYFNGTHPTQNPVSEVLWFNHSLLTYLSSDLIYSTDSLYQNFNLPLYYSTVPPKSQNNLFYYTTHLTQIQAMADSYKVAFFTRNNHPDCQADITQNNFGQAQTIFATSQSVYVLQKSTKIHINKVSSPEHAAEKTVKCKQSEFNSTSIQNLSFQNKKMIFLQKNKQLAISYQNHIVILSQQNNQFTPVQTINLPGTLNTSHYEVKYAWGSQRQIIVVGRQAQLLLYARENHQNQYMLGLKVKLESIVLSMELIGMEYIMVLTSDCKITKISLNDPSISAQQIASFPHKCNTSSLTPSFGIRENNDLIFLTASKISQLQSQNQPNQNQQNSAQFQLQIYLKPLNDHSKSQLVHTIPLQYHGRSFQLQDFKYITETDFLYLVMKTKQSSKDNTGIFSQETIFMGFQVFSLEQSQRGRLQWQWRSRQFVSAEIQDYSICQNGIVVLQNKSGQQNLTWYKIVVSYVDWPYPVQLVSQISPVAVLQIFPVSLYRSFNFYKWQGLYFVYPPTKPLAISPNGQYIASVLNDSKTLQIFTSEMTGQIYLKNYSPKSSLIQFMNDNTILEINQIQNNSVELYFYSFDFKSKTQFSYVTSEAFMIDGLKIQDMQWNMENIVFLNAKKDSFRVLSLGKDTFQKDEEVILEQNMTKPGLKLKLSTGKSILLQEPGSQTVDQYIWCQSNEYLRQGQCAQRSLGPDPNPFPTIEIVLAVMGVVAIFIVVYFAIKWHRSRSRLYRLENSLIESIAAQREDIIDIDNE